MEPILLADSVAELTKCRATSFLVTVPTVKLAEIRTHRIITQTDEVMGLGSNESLLSLNANSSRAIPVERVKEASNKNPFIPIWTENRPGMSGDYIEGPPAARASAAWLEYLNHANDIYEALKEENVHKQDLNLVFHPFAHSVVVMTGDQRAWENFFSLRCGPAVYPAVRALADKMYKLYHQSQPELLKAGQWHFVFKDQFEPHYGDTEKLLVSASCCARISYANGQRESLESHTKRAIRCMNLKHNVFEHQLRSPFESELADLEVRYDPDGQPRIGKYFSNTLGWVQARKLIESGWRLNEQA